MAGVLSGPGTLGGQFPGVKLRDDAWSIEGALVDLFDDFADAQLGIGCVLRDGVCEMDGVGPAKWLEPQGRTA